MSDCCAPKAGNGAYVQRNLFLFQEASGSRHDLKWLKNGKRCVDLPGFGASKHFITHGDRCDC